MYLGSVGYWSYTRCKLQQELHSLQFSPLTCDCTGAAENAALLAAIASKAGMSDKNRQQKNSNQVAK